MRELEQEHPGPRILGQTRGRATPLRRSGDLWVGKRHPDLLTVLARSSASALQGWRGWEMPLACLSHESLPSLLGAEGVGALISGHNHQEKFPSEETVGWRA